MLFDLFKACDYTKRSHKSDFFPRKRLFFPITGAQLVLSYHLIKVPCAVRQETKFIGSSGQRARSQEFRQGGTWGKTFTKVNLFAQFDSLHYYIATM